MSFIKKYIIPSQENNHKPYLLRGKSVAVLLAIVIVIELGIVGQTILISKGSKFLASVLPGILVELTNSDRTQNKVSTLSVNDKLVVAAQLKANDMATKGYFSHDTPEGYKPWYWLDKVGYSYDYAGENLAVNFFESADVENAWMNSPGHRANIVKANYTQIGIATATGTYQGKSAIYVVQFFGTPKTLSSTTSSATTTVEAKVAITQNISTSTKKAVLSASISPSTPTPAPTTIIKNQGQIIKEANRVVAKQRSTSTLILEIIITLTTLALLLAIFIEIKIQHPMIILNGVGLLAVIGLALVLNAHLFASYTTVTTTDALTAGSTNLTL